MENTKTSTLGLEWKRRAGGGGRTRRDFLDFVVNGQPLSEKVGGDLASCLGWFVPEHNRKAVRRLLLEDPADFPNNRRSVYVCPECGDLGCGAVSVIVEEVDGKIIWRDFGYENNYEDDVVFGEYQRIGPIAFDKVQYEETIKIAL